MPSQSQSKHVRALRRRKERRARGEFLVEGPRVLAELLRSGRPVTMVLYTGAALEEPAGQGLLAEAVEAGVPAELVSDAELRAHADTITPQGWLATAPLPVWTWSDVDGARLIILDAIGDPGNAGTLIRAAEALGAGGVVALQGTADPWGPKVVRAAAGSSLRLPVLEAQTTEVLDRLREWNTPLWVAEADGEIIERSEPRPPRLALTLGNEAAGVSAPMREAADRIVAIPMRGQVESLNAAIAGAILMDRLFGG
jgi:TrmH family RNA methyltransferase